MLWVYAAWCPCFNIKTVKKIENENWNHVKKLWSTCTSLGQWCLLYTLAWVRNKFCSVFGMIWERGKKKHSLHIWICVSCYHSLRRKFRLHWALGICDTSLTVFLQASRAHFQTAKEKSTISCVMPPYV